LCVASCNKNGGEAQAARDKGVRKKIKKKRRTWLASANYSVGTALRKEY